MGDTADLEPAETLTGPLSNASGPGTVISGTGTRRVGRFCVFNQTRQSFIGLSVRSADTLWSRLRGLIGRGRLKSSDGLWVRPSQGIHTFGVFFSIDVIYLDADQRVLVAMENLAPFSLGPMIPRCRSVLQLSRRAIYCSGTKPGDKLVICSPEDLESKISATVDLPTE